MLVDRYCNDISKKSRIKCYVQICVHSSLQLIRIDFRPLYLLHKGEFFFLLIVLNGCINRSFSFFRTEIWKIKSLLFLLLIFLDLTFRFYIFFLWKKLPALFPLFLNFCKLTQKGFFIETVAQLFQSSTVNFLIIFLKGYRTICKFRSDLFFCLLCIQSGNIHSPYGNLPSQRIVICQVCIDK